MFSREPANKFGANLERAIFAGTPPSACQPDDLIGVLLLPATNSSDGGSGAARERSPNSTANSNTGYAVVDYLEFPVHTIF